MDNFLTVPILLAALASVVILWRLVGSTKRSLPLPPGPKPKPLIGCLLEWPTDNKEWEVFREWHEQYGAPVRDPNTSYAKHYAGDIVSASVLGQTTIIINSYPIAHALLNQRGSIYSDRPTIPFAMELVREKTLGFMKMGDRHRLSRSIIHKAIGTQETVKRYFPVVEDHMRKCMLKIASNPKELQSHIRQYVCSTNRGYQIWLMPLTSSIGAIILKITYGYDVEDENDPFVEQADEYMQKVSLMATPGAFLVDLIPPCWYSAILSLIKYPLNQFVLYSEVYSRVVPRWRFQEDCT